MKILIIEDEYSLADAISESLHKENFETKIVTNGEDGENEAFSEEYDLILLDVMLPKKDGFQVLKDIRNENVNTPVIILTAKSELDDKLNGLEHGADDYITKPFHVRELIARVKVILKRKDNINDTNVLQCGNLKLNLSTGEMSENDSKIIINGKELNLLEVLMINKNHVVKRETLANKIWGYDSDAEYNNVEVYISFLRKKLKLLDSNVEIKTVRSLGYKLEEKSKDKASLRL